MKLVHLLKLSLLLAFMVVALGAWTRLSDAGLSCPDWPGCYGQILVPDTQIAGYDRPLERDKAWLEMIHRYIAALLGVFAIIIFVASLKHKYQRIRKLASGLLAMILAQGALGAFTVTELVHPLIVTAHLLGGFITTSLIFLILFTLLNRNREKIPIRSLDNTILILAIVLVCMQIFLGGWTSTNYAALSCGDYFPSCLGQYIHPINLGNIFFVGDLGVDYEFGVLSDADRIGIQILHRIGAGIVLLYILFLIFKMRTYRSVTPYLLIIGLVLGTQITLGMLNIYLSLPISIATLHNIVALLLLLSLLALAIRTNSVRYL